MQNWGLNPSEGKNSNIIINILTFEKGKKKKNHNFYELVLYETTTGSKFGAD